MTKASKRSVPGIRTEIKERSANTVTTVTTTRIPTKKSRKRKSTGIPTVTIGRGVATTIDGPPTIAEDSTDLVQMVTIVSLGTNVVMRRVQKMNNAQCRAENIINNPGITGVFSKPRKSKPYQ